MEKKVTAFAAIPDATFGQRPAGPVRDSGPRAPTTDPTPDLRLVIEEDQGSGSFVYKTVDRVTGEVVQQLPRAEVLKLRAAAAYVAGQVIRTRA